MNIGAAARATGLPARTIRYYESIGLLPVPSRGANGYRDYRSDDLDAISFVHRSRDVGFTLEECAELLALYRDPNRHSADVKHLVTEKCADIEARIKRLQSMANVLRRLAQRCAGDEGSDCAIIDGLAADAG